MDANVGLVFGSHNINELVVIMLESEVGVSGFFYLNPY